MTHGPATRSAPRRRQSDNGTDSLDNGALGGEFNSSTGHGALNTETTSAAPDGGWGWVVAFASFMIHIIADGITYSFGIFYVEYLSYFGEGKGTTAWIASILVGVTLCSGPISSSFVNRYGCRAVTIAGAILSGVCLFLSMFAQNVLTLYLTIGLGTGLGFGLIYLPAIVSVTIYFDKYRSLATGIAVCGSGLGTFIFAPLTRGLITTYGWRGAMLILSAIVLNNIIFGALFRPIEPKIVPAIQMEDFGDKSNNVSSGKLSIKSRSDNLYPEKNDSLQRSNSVGHSETKIAPNGTLMVNEEANRLTTSLQMLASENSRSRTSLKRAGSGALYRKDVFYQGSLVNLTKSNSAAEIPEAVKLMDKYGSLRQENPFAEKNASASEENSCVPCSQETKDTLHEMLDFSLLLDPIFILFTVSNFCTSIGLNVPYVYITAQAEELKVDKDMASYLLSVIGIANTFGRIILGYISDKPWVNRLMVYNWSLTICGIGVALTAFCNDFYSLAVSASVFGFTIGAYVGLTSVILVDLIGLDKLTNGFGLLLLFQGFASFIGPPMAGFLYDYLGSYGPGFLLAGFKITLSGLMLFFIPALQRWVARRKPRNQIENGSALHL